MYADNAQISHRQLFRQLVTGLLGSYFLSLPVLSGMSGRQGILSLVTGMGIYLFFCIYFVRIRTVFQSPEKYMGKIVGKLFVFLYLSWLWLIGVYLLLVAARITGRFLIEGSVPWIIILLAGAAAYLGSHQGLERRGRMAEVCFPVLLVILAGMLLLGILRMKPEYLQEMGELSVKGWLRGSYQVLCLLLPFAYLPVTLGNVRKPGEAGKTIGSALLLLTGLMVLILLLLQGSFGLGGYEHKAFPMVDFMAGIRIPGNFLERVDVFWLAAALFSILFGLGSVFFYNHELLVRIKMERTAFFTVAGVIAAAELCEKLDIQTEIFLRITMNLYGPLFLVLLLYAGLAGKRKRIAVKTAGLLLCILSLNALNGCGVSLEDRNFPLSMSADYRDGQYEVIYGIPGLTRITGQTKEETEESRAQALTYTGKTPAHAEENFNQNQENYLDMGHIKVLVLGNGILENQRALKELLDYLEEKPSVAGNIYVFACENPGELMSLDGEGTESVGDYLTGILENNLEGRPKDAATLQDLYNARHRNEKIPELPQVSVVNKRPEIGQYS